MWRDMEGPDYDKPQMPREDAERTQGEHHCYRLLETARGPMFIEWLLCVKHVSLTLCNLQSQSVK